MRREIPMPTLTEDAEEGIVVAWFVVPPATVSEGDLVAEVQVEKVSEEVHAPADGALVETLVQQGGVVAQGAPIAVMEVGAPSGGPEPGPERPAPRAAPQGPPPVPAPASPSARRLAREMGVDLAGVSGSGPGGRIVEADVLAAAEAPSPAAPSGAAPVPISPMRRTIATRLTAGLAQAAQLTLTAEADVTALAEHMVEAGRRLGRRVGYTDAIVLACARMLPDHPRLASRWSDEGLVPPGAIDIGVAVATEDGLVVPVVRAADAKDLGTVGAEIADLAERVRSGRITRPETEGAVFSVTNLGAHRVDAFTPLLDLPQAALLGVGRARMRPAVVGDQVVPRRIVVLSLTFDHRVVDGDPAAAFLDGVIATLEDPSRLE